ncbi:MAG: MFS transporter [Solirubrobacterales bacterium]|nr:MFS transporter [Solirubrobacterales bacterium]
MGNVLKLPAYRRLLAAYTLNELAWQIGSVALAYFIYRHTGSAIGAMAFFLCSQFVPALLSAFAVARLDRGRPRRVLPALYLAEGAAFLGLAILAQHFALAPILVLATIDGIIALVARSLARATTVEVTTTAGLLREGNAVSNGAFSICYMAGPALGGAIIVAGGASAALFTNAALFALIAITLLSARGLPTAYPDRGPATGRVRAALAYVRRHAAIRALFSLQAIAVLFFTLSIPVEVVFVQRSLHGGAGAYGGLLTAWGAGAVAGSAVYARWHVVPMRKLIALGAGALGVGFIVMAAAPSLAIAVVGCALAGIGNGIEAVSARTALQEQVEQSWMALMMSFNESLHQLVPGAGILLGGALAALVSPRVALAVAGAGALGVTGAAWQLLRPRVLVAPAAGRSPSSEASARGRAPASVGRHQ